MDESCLMGDSLKQAWAEGYDIDALNESNDPRTWIDQGVRLPPRDAVQYPFHAFPVYFSTVGRWLSTESLDTHLRRLWTGALDAVGTNEEEEFNRITHWPLISAMDLSMHVSDANAYLAWWLTHRSYVQKTSAEQYVIQLGRRPFWHPYREATGAMRRAPLWGTWYAATPDYAGSAAYRDAITAHAGWGAWTAVAVAQIAARLCAGSLSLSEAFIQTIQALTPHQLAAGTLLAECQTAYAAGRSLDEWLPCILTTFSGYPKDHSLPNFVILMATSLFFSGDVKKSLADIGRMGWDSVGNRIVFGALEGLRNPSRQSQALPAFVEPCIQRSIQLIPKPPHILRGVSGAAPE